MTPLTPTRVARLQQLFEEVLLAPPDQRMALLERACDGDAALRDEVLALVAAHDSGATLLDHGPDLTPLAQSMIEPERWIGQRIGPWQVTRLIGFGGMGTVCEAVRADEQFQKRVAVKFLHVHASQPSAVRRFRAERQILANLDHPNVATLLDGGVTGEGQPYLVMEYIDGEPITTWADNQGLSRRARVRLCLQVCAAVEAAHRNLIVHRDLKPGNILVTRDGRVKLLDFGIARLLGEVSTDGSGGTRGSEPLSFTPAYAAPEQMRAQPVTTATDVFALGAVFFRLLAGRVPFESREDPEAAAGAAGLAPDLDSILARAMAVDRQQRYATVEALRHDLQRWLDGQPVQAHAGGRLYRAGKFVRRHRAGVAAGTLAMLAILVASGMALWQYQKARQSAADQQQLNAFLMDVLGMSDPFEEGDELTLSAALDRAAGNIDVRFADRPDLSAQIRYGIGYSMASRYRLEQAQVQLERALQESLQQFGPRDLRTLRVRDGIAGLHLERSEFAEAETGYREVIEAMQAGGHTADPFHVTVLGNLGNVYLQQERYAEADELLQRALAAEARLQAPMAPNDRGALLSNVAHAAHGLEDQPRADRYYREAAAVFAALFPQGSPDLAILYNNHAMLLDESGDLEGALQMHRQSLDMRRRVFRGQHPMLVNALAAIARLSLRTGDAATALAHATEGAAIADEVYTEPNRFHPSIHATLAAARLASDDAPGALQAWSRAQRLLVALPDAPPSVAGWVEEVRTRLCADGRIDCPSAAVAAP